MAIFMEISKRTTYSNVNDCGFIYVTCATFQLFQFAMLNQIKINKHTSPIRPIQSNIPNNYVFSLFLYLMHEYAERHFI